MKNGVKSIAIAAFAAFTNFTLLATTQAQDFIYLDEPSVGQPLLVPAGGSAFEEDFFYHPPRHRRGSHQGNGFSFELEFNQPHVIYRPRHPRPVYQPRPRPVIQISRAHVQWCYSRYRTYDHRSNSFVIRHGQRAYCVSPYSY